MYKGKKSKAKKTVTMAKRRAYEDLFARLETNEVFKQMIRRTKFEDS